MGRRARLRPWSPRPGRNFVPFAAGTRGRPGGGHRPTAREHTQRALVVRDRRPPVSAVSAAPAASGGPVPLHRRTLEYEAFDAGDSLRMVGRLQDTRPWARDGQAVTLVHDIEIGRASCREKGYISA